MVISGACRLKRRWTGREAGDLICQAYEICSLGGATAEIQARLAAIGVKVVLLPNGMLNGLPHHPDGQYLTPEGYHTLAEQLVGWVAAALGIDPEAPAIDRKAQRRATMTPTTKATASD
jgi:hypothetical protein